MKGIILAGKSDNRLHPLTLGIPKQLLPIYDKPMIFYPLDTLIEAGISDIMIIIDPSHYESFINTLGDGSGFGAHFSYASQISPDGAAQAFTIADEFIGTDPVCLITGDCIIIGENRASKLRKAIRAAEKSGQATIFASRDFSPEQYGVLKLNSKGKYEKVEGVPTDKYHMSITGLYVFPKGVANYAKIIEKSERGRLEITSLNQLYQGEDKLQIQILGSDFHWFDTNTFDSLMTVSNYIKNQSKTIKNNIPW